MIQRTVRVVVSNGMVYMRNDLHQNECVCVSHEVNISMAFCVFMVYIVQRIGQYTVLILIFSKKKKNRRRKNNKNKKDNKYKWNDIELNTLCILNLYDDS